MSGDVTLGTQIVTEADALASAVTVAGFLAVGATPASAKIDLAAETEIKGGAEVTSTGGNIMLTAANNFVDGNFLTGKGANVSTNMTTGAGVSISASNLSAEAEAQVIAQVGANATLNAAGNVSVDARSSNFAEARTRTTGGGLVSVASSSPEATAGGATRAKMLGNVTGSQNIVVTAQSSDIAAAGASATTGGAIDVGSSSVEATASPNVEATIGGQTHARGNIDVQALSTTDADASSRSTGGGLVSVADLQADASANPNVNAGVAAGSSITAGSTLSISALHGANPAPTADGSFAPAAVNTTSNTIDLGAKHGLLTGDTVTYQAGTAAVGGLTDGREYGVVFVTDNALQLGSAFNTDPVLDTSTPAADDVLPNPVDLARDTIRFAGAHNLQSGDRVVFNAAEGAFGVGGLTEGATYIVNVIDARTIKLASAPLLAAQTFSGAGVDDATDTITAAAHGFANGQAVTYRAPAATEFNSTAADVAGSGEDPFAPADNNNIYLGAGHGLVSGDEVIYTASDDARTIGGLFQGTRYFVIFDAAKPDEIQLALTRDQAVGVVDDPATTDVDETIAITPIHLVPTKEADDGEVVHSLRKVGDQPIGGLLDGVTYYISDSTATTFKLKNGLDEYVELTPTDPLTGATLTGTHSFRTEGVDLTSLGTGEQQLAIDITSAGTGSQLLEGVGGARALAGAPSGDGVVTSAASGSGGGLVKVSTASTDASSTPTVGITVQANAALAASDIVIEATSIGNASSTSANSGGGLVSVGAADSDVTIDTTGTVTFQNNAKVDATNNITIRAITGQNATVLAQTGSAGLAGFGDASASANLDYAATVDIGKGVAMNAEGDLIAESKSSVDVNASADSNAAGLGASADTDARVTIDGATLTLVRENARLEAANVDLAASVTAMKARAKAESDSSAAIANADADAEVSVNETTDVALRNGAWVEGDSVDLVSRHQGIDLSTRADADADGLYGDADAPATTDYESSSAIHVDNGATVAAHDVQVLATQSIARYDRSARADGGGFGSGDSDEDGDFNAGRDIVYDGDLVLLIRPDPVLFIDEDGRVIEAVNITVNGGQGKGYDVTSDGFVSVDDIGNLKAAGTALIQANSVGGQDGEDAPESTISGSQGTARVKTTFDAITITNLSGEELTLNDILPANPDASGKITLDAEDVTVEFDIADSSGPTNIKVDNGKGTSDVVLNGLIDNPTGLTVILNGGADGVIRDTATGLLRTDDAVFIADAIGSAANRLNVELVRSAGRLTGLQATAEGGDIYLDLKGRLRVTDALQSEFDTGTLKAAGHVDLLLQAAVQETDPLGVVEGINFVVTQDPSLSGKYVNHFEPDGGSATKLDPAIYADITKAAPIAGKYDFGHLIAGGNIVINAAAPGVGDTRVHVRANTDVLGSGYIHAITNGDIELTETAGDFRIELIRSNAGNVALEALHGSVYDIIVGAADDGLTPWVIGNSISLRAGADLFGEVTDSSVGFLSDFLEINSSQQADGKVDGVAEQEFYVRETAGDLRLGGVASQYSDVTLITLSGSILDADNDERADIQGAKIDLYVAGGGVGASSNDVEIFGAGAGQEQSPAVDIDTVAPQSGRLFVEAAQSVYIAEVAAALNVLQVRSASGNVRLTVNDSAHTNEHFNMMVSGQTQFGVSIAAGNINAPGTVQVWAGDDVNLPAGTLIESAISVEIHGDANTPDGDTDIGSTITIQGDVVRAPTVLIAGGRDMDFIQLLSVDGINAGNATILRGNESDDRLFVQAVSSVAGTSTKLEGSDGADRFYASSNASKTLFTSGGVYDDDTAPLDRLSGNLSKLGGLVIDAGTGGNGGTEDGIYLSADSDSAGLSGALGAGSVSGFGLPSAITYSASAIGGRAALLIETGSGSDTVQVDGMASNVVAYVHAGAGADTMNAGSKASPVSSAISGIVAFLGEGGADTLNVHGDASSVSGQLTAIGVNGMGMGSNRLVAVHNEVFGAGYDITDPLFPAAIYYGTRDKLDGIETVSSTVETVNVLLGGGKDVFDIDSVYSYGTTTVHGGAGEDKLTVGSTPFGLHPASLRRVDFVAGELHLNGGDDIDTIVVDDSGDDNQNTGAYAGDRVTGLDMVPTGAIIFDAPDDITIQLGAQADTFYVPQTTAGLTTRLMTGGGFDRVYVGTTQGHEDEGTLDGIQGEFRIDGEGPEAKDALYFNDQSNTSSQSFVVSNALDAEFTLGDGRPWRFDTTTVERSGMHAVYYRRMETVVLNAGEENDIVNLHATHREQSPDGGKNSSFTVNGGGGDDTINLGAIVPGGFSLASFAMHTGAALPTPADVRGIPVMVNGGDGSDTVHFRDSASTADTDLAFAEMTFADIFPLVPPSAPPSADPEWTALFQDIFGFDPQSVDYVRVILSETGTARPLNVNALGNEHVMVTLGSGDDVTQLTDGVYNFDLTVYSGQGDDTFNVEDGVDNRGYVATLNGEEGDDLLFAQFEQGVPSGTVSVVFNGGPNTGGDTLRIAGNGIATGTYTPSSTTARAGSLNIGGNLFSFTGVEPLVVHGLSDFDVLTGDSAAALAIDTVNVADLQLSNLVLHTLTIDGVVTWTQQTKLVTPDALETKHMGTVSAISGNTLVVGAELDGSTRGVVYVYTWNAAQARWVEQAKLYAPDRDSAGEGFGKSVAIDGDRLIVGAPNDSTVGANGGAVYVYARSGGVWAPEAKLRAADGAAGATFGQSVGISGTSAIVGSAGGSADSAYVFVKSGATTWVEQIKLVLGADTLSDFGAAVTIAGDTAVIGAPLRDSFTGGLKADAGAAYVWTRSGSAWMLASTLTASEQDAGEHFGAVLDMVSGRVVIGAPLWDNPAAEHFDFTTDSGMRAVQIGTQVLVSNTYNTALGERGFVYQYVGAPATINLGTENYLDQTRWMTPQDHGRAFVFEGSGSSWTRVARLTADGGLPEAEALIEGKAGDHFGAAVAIDGDFVAVGAPGYDGTALNQGAGYVFYRLPDAGWGSGPSWAHATGFKEHTRTSDFGSDVIDRGLQVLTADDYDLTKGRRETVYRYIGADDYSVNLASENYLNRNLWVEVPNSGKLLADRPAGSSAALTPPYNTADRFGTSVAVGGGRVVMAMPGFNETASDGVVLRADVGAMRTYSTDFALPSGDSAMWAEVLRDPRHANQPSDAASRFGSVTHYDPASRTLFVADPGNNVVYTYVNEGLYWRPVQTISSPDSVYITAAGLTAHYYDIVERNTLPTSFTGELMVPLISGQKEFAVYKGTTGGSFAPDAISNSGDRTVRPPESDSFAARWVGQIFSTSTQNVVFHLGSDDGSKLFIDGVLRINNDGLHAFQTLSSVSFQLTEGVHNIEVQFFEKTGGAGIRLDYQAGGVTRLLTGPFGKDIDVESGWMVIGAPDAKAYVYAQSGENWNLTQELSGAGGFGTSVAISASKLVVGMPSAPTTYASWGQADPNYNLNLGAAGGAVVYNRSGSFWFQDRLLMPDDSTLPTQTSYWGTFSPSDWNQVHIQGKGWYPIGGHWVSEGNGTEVILKPWMMMAAVDYDGGDWHAWWLFNFSDADSTQHLPGSIDDDIEYIIVGSVQDLSGVYAKLRRDGAINTYYGGAHYVYERNDSFFAVGPRTIALAMDISGGDSGFQSNWNFGIRARTW